MQNRTININALCHRAAAPEKVFGGDVNTTNV